MCISAYYLCMIYMYQIVYTHTALAIIEIIIGKALEKRILTEMLS